MVNSSPLEDFDHIFPHLACIKMVLYNKRNQEKHQMRLATQRKAELSVRERTITIAEAQQILASLTGQLSEETFIITHDDQPVLTLMTYQAHQALLANVESLQTVLEIMLGGEKTDAPRPAKAAVTADKHISWEEFQKEVGWE